MLKPQQLHEVLLYDHLTGIFTWRHRPQTLFRSEREYKRWNTRYAGKSAFSLKRHGYLDGMIFRKMYKSHRVAWAMYYGEWPKEDVDHINGIRSDNKIENLRSVSRMENSRNTKLKSNNTSGFMGVTARKNKWVAYINENGKNTYLGIFNNIEDAVSARKFAETRIGYHANHGRRV